MKQKFITALKDNLGMFAVFFKIGLFSFGGGYAMLSMIEHEVVDKHKWLTHDELLDVFAIAESTPGAISINIATFIGTKRAGVFGGIFTTLGVVLPSFLVILGLSYIIDIVRENEWVGYLFRGIRIGALVLIVRGAVSFVKNTKRKVVAYVLMAAMFCLALFTDISVIYLMLGAIGISIIEVIVSHSIRYRKFLRNCEKTAGEYSRGGESAPCPEDMLAVNMLSPEEQAAANADAELLSDDGDVVPPDNGDGNISAGENRTEEVAENSFSATDADKGNVCDADKEEGGK